MRTLVALALAVAAACGPRGQFPEQPAPAAPPKQTTVATPAVTHDVDPQLLRTITVLATRREPSADELAATRRAIAAGQLTIAGYIDQLLRGKDFAARVAPLVILRHLLTEQAVSAPSHYVLAHTDGPNAVYFLDKPCKPATAIHVHPWWDLDHEIAICPDSYKPAQWTADVKKGREPMSCLSLTAPDPSAGAHCGCGPNLIRCYVSGAQREATIVSMREELRATVEYVVAHDLPAERIFTSNETYRDRNAEQVRLLDVLEARRDANPEAALRALASWPAEGKWAPREELGPGEHAGVMTSPLLLYNLPDRRQRMSIIYDPLWCMQPDSNGATPEMLMQITNGNLQIDSAAWHQLAARPLCTNCHARLDYGMQFFWGYPNGYLQAFYSPPTQQKGKGPLYGHDIDDPRGEADLNPHGFAELAVAQPEFRACMARDFAAYVLGNHATPQQLDTVMAHAKPNATSARELMRTALLALVDEWSKRTAAGEPVPAAVTTKGDQVAVTPALHRELDAHCLDCHDGNPDRVDLSKSRLPRATIVAMLDDVAFGRMPKDGALARPERKKFVSAFVDATWSGGDADAARAYFGDGMVALPAFRPEVVFDLVHAGEDAAQPWRMLEQFVRSDLQQVTPGLATISSVAAIEACNRRLKGKPQPEIDRCISDAIRLSNLAIVPR